MDSANGAIVVKDADFHWGSEDSFHLSDINFVAMKVYTSISGLQVFIV